LDLPPEPQIILPKEIFASVATEPEAQLQIRIEKLLDHDESLEEILEFLQNGSNAPAYIRKGFKDYQMEAGLLFYQGPKKRPNRSVSRLPNSRTPGTTTDPRVSKQKILLAGYASQDLPIC
jgi:hypothetical protein